MLAQFDFDADVHIAISDLYESMGNAERARSHVEKAVDLDGINPKIRMEAANFYLHNGLYDEAMSSINQVNHAYLLGTDQLEEYQFIQATIYMQMGEYETATNFLGKLLTSDPWNVTYLVQMLYSKMMKICEDKGEYDDPAVESLISGGDLNLDWEKFDRITYELKSLHETELIYLRTKLRFLYTKNDHTQIINLVQSAVQWNPMVGGNEIIRLLNTNFDSAEIYYALSTLYAEQWQLQVSSMWAEQALLHPDLDDVIKMKVYLRLADNYLWEGDNIEKALQYATIAHDIGSKNDESANMIIGHAYLKKGRSKEAGVFLDQSGDLSIESSYLKGLLEYRNGAVEKANKIWKPLLTLRSSTVKEHHIKQELLKFYFEDAPYLNVN
jgi:tetratricopeptide (TPR) repeat protein